MDISNHFLFVSTSSPNCSLSIVSNVAKQPASNVKATGLRYIMLSCYTGVSCQLKLLYSFWEKEVLSDDEFKGK